MKRLIFLLVGISLFAQKGDIVNISASMVGTGQTITGNLSIPLSPSTLTWSCTPNVLQKGSSVSCTASLDSSVPSGMTGTVTLGTPPAGFTVSPSVITIAAGSSSGGPVVVTRQ